eukprot:SAG31_NODE_36766_length_310_cov_0.985782_1_plen_49_part_10
MRTALVCNDAASFRLDPLLDPQLRFALWLSCLRFERTMAQIARAVPSYR